jgi:precorrin-4/cobalt-precorrin-4 C11-methyltransferase
MADKYNTVYFIGAGPGDPKYLTLEGRDALSESAVVYAVDPYPDTFAPLLEGKVIKDPFDMFFEEITTEIVKGLSRGDVAFLIPGDMTVFSPFLPLVEHFGDRACVVAGVGTVNAAAALLKRTLDMPGISHSIVMTSPKHIDKRGDADELSRLAKAAGTMVLFMNNRPLTWLSDELYEGFAPDTDVAIVSRIGMEGEKIYRATLSTMADVVGSDDIFGLKSGDPSLALVLVGDVLSARSDPAFWDKRKKQFWDKRKRQD